MHIGIVGSGVVGMQTAWHLRLRGHRVTIFDPDPGNGATRAAAGMLAPISEVQFGQQGLYPLMLAARREYPQLIAQLERVTDRPHGYLENGTLLVAADRADLARAADHARVQTEYGMETRSLSASRLLDMEPGLNPRLAGGFEAPTDQQVDPRLLLEALRAALVHDLDPTGFAHAGPSAAWIMESVSRIDPVGDRTAGYDVTAGDSGPHRVDRVLVACGVNYGRIGGVLDRLPLDLRPVYGDILRLKLREGQLAPGEKHVVNATIRATVLGRQVYLVPRADGGLVIGASVREDNLPGVNAGCVQELLEDAVTVVPGVRDMELVEAMARARPGTPDDIPYVGPVPGAPGVVVSTGYSRHGILLAPLGARLGADLLTGASLSNADARLLETMDPGRFGAHTDMAQARLTGGIPA
ncbi:glycine oxidase ThiO [Rothia uropygioeca]|uniref:glycine oxidase ThiO n=1 Tax=Kocuria sp. 257 TaxID=2021970 RepID=UPI0010123090|nr:glycine oxidase ThiO [Kocuria sp. 257]